MNYLQSILSLDATSFAGGTSAAAGADVSGNDRSVELRLADGLATETETAATFVAVCASISNALSVACATRHLSARALQTYAVPDMPMLAAALPRLIDGYALSSLFAPSQEFLARNSLVQRMSRAFAREIAGWPQDRTVELSSLQDAWAHACEAMLALRAELVNVRLNLAAETNNPEARTAHRRLSSLLSAAANGGYPCVERGGTVVIPGWAERRRHPRQYIDINIEICIFDRLFAAHTFDASSGGLGIDELPIAFLQLARQGDAISFTLPGGHMLRGSIAWIAGAAAGITLTEPLAPHDPILAV